MTNFLLSIHDHALVPWNHMGRGDCCGRFEDVSDGYYCNLCRKFFHEKCTDETYEYIKHPFHSIHTLRVQHNVLDHDHTCNLCGMRIVSSTYYRCEICEFHLDLHCASCPQPKVIDVPEIHGHKLTYLVDFQGRIEVSCAVMCGKIGDYEFAYKCHKCNIAYHVDCLWNLWKVKQPSEVNHSYHSLHPLKLLLGRLPEYSDGKCRLCGRKVDIFFYHCSSCNLTLDMGCVLHPPPQSLLDLKAHDHQLTLLPRLDSFTCNACGLKGDRSPYVCFQCGFMIHQECLALPRVININRHEHRVSRTSVLGVVNSVCGVCRKKVDWTCGGYSCQKCHGYVVHSKCATREDVCNGKELEGLLEEIEDTEPYVVIDENTIQHCSHKEHYLRLNGNGLLWEEKKRCNACSHHISFQSFYGCTDCDFFLHKNCAETPKKKRHILHNERLTLVTSEANCFHCNACHRMSNGFMYKDGNVEFDVRCSSISEPFVHPSQPYHPLYYIPPNKYEICNGCNKRESHVLRCIEDGCEFVLGFKCATLPLVVKHKVDDHPLSLCYGEEGASGKYWCDICEKEISPKKWFYTCTDHRASLHTECVLGEFAGLMPRGTVIVSYKWYEVVLNNSVSRPFCLWCKSRCISPIILKVPRTIIDTYFFCSLMCIASYDEKILYYEDSSDG